MSASRSCPSEAEATEFANRVGGSVERLQGRAPKTYEATDWAAVTAALEGYAAQGSQEARRLLAWAAASHWASEGGVADALPCLIADLEDGVKNGASSADARKWGAWLARLGDAHITTRTDSGCPDQWRVTWNPVTPNAPVGNKYRDWGAQD